MPSEATDLMFAGIFSPVMGTREDIPAIMLPDGFTAESIDILNRDGMLQRVKKRLSEMFEIAFAIGTVTATHDSKIITASTGAGTWGTITHKPCWHERKITITEGEVDTDYVIDTINDDGNQITLTANYTGTGGAGLAYSIGTAGQKVAMPDGFPAIRYHTLTYNPGSGKVEYLLAFTKMHIYLWNQSWSAYIEKFECSDDCLLWDTAEIHGQVIATNGVDFVQVWGSTPSALFANLGSASGLLIGGTVYITAAKHIVEFQGYIILGAVTLDEDFYDNDYYWCSYDDETDWDHTGEGDANYREAKGKGQLNGFKKFGYYLIIAKTESMHTIRLINTTEIFYRDELYENIGLLAPHAITEDSEGRICFIDSNYNIRRLPGREILLAAKKETLRQINPACQYNIEAVYIRDYDLLLWSIPHTSTAVSNNKILWLDPQTDIIGEYDMAVAAFGEYTRQTAYEWATLPFADWSAWLWDNWAATENVIGFPFNLCSDYSGYTYTMNSSPFDDGVVYEGSFVLSLDLLAVAIEKRFGVSLMTYKRIQWLQLWFKSEKAGEISAAIKADGSPNWQVVGSGSLVSNDNKDTVTIEMFPDVRARHHKLKISGANPFRFLGVIIGFLPDGEN